MPFSTSTQMITAPVSIRDLQECFGLTDTDLGTLITTGDINMWARYKPVKVATVGILTDTQRANVNHGITVPTITNVTSSNFNAATIQDVSANANDWAYEKPVGGTSSPFRLADFALDISAGYFHDAVPPLQINYPRNGWTFMRGESSSRIFTISFGLDPSNSAYNLQAEDFAGDLLDLNEWRFIAYVENIGLAASDTILSGGEISGDTIDVTIPSGTGSYNLGVWICMYRVNGSTYDLLPMLPSPDYDPSNLVLHIIDDAQASGGGIAGNTSEEMFNNVEFSSALDGTYKTAWVSTDNGTAEWCLVSQGDLYVKMKLTNTSSSSSTVQRAHFQLDLNGQGAVSATTMYNSSKTSKSSITIASGATVTIYLYFEGIFSDIGSDWTSSNKNSSWSMDFTRSSATLFGGDIYAMSGTNGWVSRKE